MLDKLGLCWDYLQQLQLHEEMHFAAAHRVIASLADLTDSRFSGKVWCTSNVLNAQLPPDKQKCHLFCHCSSSMRSCVYDEQKLWQKRSDYCSVVSSRLFIAVFWYYAAVLILSSLPQRPTRYSLACVECALHPAFSTVSVVSSICLWCHVGCVQPPAQLECGGAAEVLCHQVQ